MNYLPVFDLRSFSFTALESSKRLSLLIAEILDWMTFTGPF